MQLPEHLQGQYASEIEKIGKENPYARILKVGSIYRRGSEPGKYSVQNPYYQSPQKIKEEQAAAFAEFKQQQEEAITAAQANIADQLKIVQDERGAVSRLMDDYRNMLTEEADAKRKAQEEQKVALQTARANTARSTLGSNLQIRFGGGVRPFSGGSMSRRSGTGQFKRRLNIGQSNMVNI